MRITRLRWSALGFLFLVSFFAYLIAQGPYEGESRERAESFAKGAKDWARIFRPRARDPDDGLIRKSALGADSDESDCDFSNRTADQMIVTRFSGHLLQYPCTARTGEGSWSTVHHPVNGTLQSSRFVLTLRLWIDSEKNSIWRQSSAHFSEDAVGLKAGLKNYPADWSVENHSMFDGAAFVHRLRERGIEIYLSRFDHPFYKVDYEVGGVVRSAIGSCHARTAEQVITLLESGSEALGAVCSRLYWSLKPSVRVMVQSFRNAHLTSIEDYFKLIDTQLQDIFVGEYDTTLDPSSISEHN